MIGIDVTTCISHPEAESGHIVNGFGVFLHELLDEIVLEKKEKDYILIASYYQENYLKRRFGAFQMIIIGGVPARLVHRFLGHTMMGVLRKSGAIKRAIDRSTEIDVLWELVGQPGLCNDVKKHTVVTVHDYMGCHTQEDYKAYENMINKADVVVTVSQYIKDETIKIFPGADRKDIEVIHNSTVESSCDETAVEGVGSKFILCINRYAKNKNQMTLLKAYSLLKKKGKIGDIQLVFVGASDAENVLEELQEFSRANNIAGDVRFLWKITEEQKKFLLKRATLFVSPSLNEGFGRTPLEAMMYSVPVITTQETSLMEATMGKAYYVQNALDEKELAGAIEEIVSEPPSKKSLDTICREVANQYSARSVLRKYEAAFERARVK